MAATLMDYFSSSRRSRMLEKMKTEIEFLARHNSDMTVSSYIDIWLLLRSTPAVRLGAVTLSAPNHV
jgi:hypothetical protein